MPNLSLNINLEKIILGLFCGYAFSLPFELVFEYLLDIETIFKPFRVFSLLILGTFVIKSIRDGILINLDEKEDFLIYGIFVYGIIISCYRLITEIFSMKLFVNDLFQAGLHVATFFVFKQMLFTKTDAKKILRFFVTGILINSSYIFYQYTFYMQWARSSGFIDNPNYAAFGVVVVLTYFLLKSNFTSSWKKSFLYFFLILLFLFVFNLEASRTGLLMLLFVLVPVFIFSNIRRKFMVSIIMFFSIFLMSSSFFPSDVEVGGLNALAKRVERSLEGEEDVRIPVWEGVFRILEDKGYAGLGIGQFKANFVEYYSKEPNKLILEMVNRGYYMSPHNDLLAILADYGLPGCVLYILFMISSLRKLLLNVLAKGTDDEKLMSQFKIVAFICIIIFGLTAENFMHQLFWFLMMFTTKGFIDNNDT